jgi:hypothetical protein
LDVVVAAVVVVVIVAVVVSSDRKGGEVELGDGSVAADSIHAYFFCDRFFK